MEGCYAEKSTADLVLGLGHYESTYIECGQRHVGGLSSGSVASWLRRYT